MRFARWMGGTATLEPRVGGAFRAPYPHGAAAAGEVLELDPPSRIVLSWGYESGEPSLPAGATRIEISLLGLDGRLREVVGFWRV